MCLCMSDGVILLGKLVSRLPHRGSFVSFIRLSSFRLLFNFLDSTVPVRFVPVPRIGCLLVNEENGPAHLLTYAGQSELHLGSLGSG